MNDKFFMLSVSLALVGCVVSMVAVGLVFKLFEVL